MTSFVGNSSASDVQEPSAQSMGRSNPIGRLFRRLLQLRTSAAGFQVRGFAISSMAQQGHLEGIGMAFIHAFNAALKEDDPKALKQRTDAVPPDHRGFAIEGATAGLAVADAVGFRQSCLAAWLSLTESEFTYLAHVGTGWALALLPWRRAAILRMLDPVHHWLAMDGLGFRDTYFRPRLGLSGQRLVGRGYAARAYDQGVGRALWFLAGGDAGRAVQLIGGVDETRRSDLWSGLGLAMSYAGYLRPMDLLCVESCVGEHRAALRQGAAFAAEACARAGHIPLHTIDAVRALTRRDAGDVARTVRIAREDAVLVCSRQVPSYESWRQLVQQRLEDHP